MNFPCVRVCVLARVCSKLFGSGDPSVIHAAEFPPSPFVRLETTVLKKTKSNPKNCPPGMWNVIFDLQVNLLAALRCCLPRYIGPSYLVLHARAVAAAGSALHVFLLFLF